jgi:GDP-L-fucose synthase
MPIDLKGSRVLLTGGAGLIGRPLLDLLVAEGAILSVWDMYEPAGLPKGVEYKNVDLNFDQDIPSTNKFEYIFHLAGAKGGTGIGRTKGADFLIGNVKSFTNLADRIRQAGNKLKRLLYVSSVGAYPGDKHIFREDQMWDGVPHESDAAGGWSKRFGEIMCGALRMQHGLETVIVRPTNCFGPYDRFDAETGMVVGALIRKMADANGEPVKVWGDGLAMRDLLYSEDAAKGMLLAMTNGTDGEAYNLGTGKPISIKEVAETIARNFGARLEFDAERPTGGQIRAMDMTKSKRDLGFVASTPFGVAIAQTCEWFRNHHDSKRFDPFK